MINLQHLCLLTTPGHYLEVVRRMERDHDAPCDNVSAFDAMAPKYLIARCPLCGADYHEPLDTYSLHWWQRPSNGERVFWRSPRTRRCRHFYLVHPFIHLHGIVPAVSDTELDTRSTFIAEAPHIIPMILTPDTGCQAVLHALPICRIENDAFVPRYTLYMVSYFAPPEEHAALTKRIFAFSSTTDDYYSRLIYPFPGKLKPEEGRTWWNLKPWVEQGKLSWLAPDTPHLPLQTGPLEAFPYGDIEGRIDPYVLKLPPRPLQGRHPRSAAIEQQWK